MQGRGVPASLVLKLAEIRGKRGAGEGNRTLILSLEGWYSTVELHPLVGLRDYKQG